MVQIKLGIRKVRFAKRPSRQLPFEEQKVAIQSYVKRKYYAEAYIKVNELLKQYDDGRTDR